MNKLTKKAPRNRAERAKVVSLKARKRVQLIHRNSGEKNLNKFVD